MNGKKGFSFVEFDDKKSDNEQLEFDIFVSVDQGKNFVCEVKF